MENENVRNKPCCTIWNLLNR